MPPFLWVGTGFFIAFSEKSSGIAERNAFLRKVSDTAGDIVFLKGG